MTYWVPKPRPQCRQTVETHWENLHNLHMKHDQHCTHTTPKIEDVRTLFPNEVTELYLRRLVNENGSSNILFNFFGGSMNFPQCFIFCKRFHLRLVRFGFRKSSSILVCFHYFPFLKKECKSQNMGQIVIFWEETLTDYKLSFLKRR